VLIFTILAGAMVGQPLLVTRGPLDASNSEFHSAPKAAEERGTISVHELQRPLEGRGLKLLIKARESFARGEAVRGMEQLRAAAREQSAEPYALGMLATEHIKRGDLDTALVELQSAVALQPGIAANHSNLAYLLGVRQQNEEALVHARKAVQLEPLRCKTRYVIGQILLQMGRKEEAEFHLRRAAEEIPAARALLSRVAQ
jgi:Flp pilus assembly protein TadD